MTTQPHSRPQHSAWYSVACLLAQLLDYWAGYWLVVRQALARSGLVIFDRYFDDLLIDARRYRYGGPMWLVKVICPLIPTPDLVLVLDAATEVILSRKQEVAREEVERQRQEYLKWANRVSHSRIIESYSSSSVPLACVKAEHAITEYLVRRLE